MKNLQYLFLALSMIVVWISCNCRKNPVSSTNIRELTWSIDTLNHPDNWQTSLYDVWGSSSKDVYVVGDANTTRGILWHYNGKKWTDINISITQGGPIMGTIFFDDVFGFAHNDVWACGGRSNSNPNPPPISLHTSLLINYNGENWQEIATPEGHILSVIWGLSPDNIWFGGVNGTLLHYNGTVVSKDSIPINIPKDSPAYTTISITGNESEQYMLLAYFGIPNRYYMLSHGGNNWVIEDSSFIYNSTAMWMSPSGQLYVAGESLYRRQGNKWEVVLDGHSTLAPLGIYGTDDNNIFVVGSSNSNGAVYHYNGENWFSYRDAEMPGMYYFEVWTDGREVFITGTKDSKTFILHGK